MLLKPNIMNKFQPFFTGKIWPKGNENSENEAFFKKNFKGFSNFQLVLVSYWLLNMPKVFLFCASLFVLVLGTFKNVLTSPGIRSNTDFWLVWGRYIPDTEIDIKLVENWDYLNYLSNWYWYKVGICLQSRLVRVLATKCW